MTRLSKPSRQRHRALRRSDRCWRARFTANLADQGEERGLIGPLELPRLWSRHILNCAIVAPLLRPGASATSAAARGCPDSCSRSRGRMCRFVLIEPMERRVAWLTEQVDELGLDNVEVVRARAEDVTLRPPWIR